MVKKYAALVISVAAAAASIFLNLYSTYSGNSSNFLLAARLGLQSVFFLCSILVAKGRYEEKRMSERSWKVILTLCIVFSALYFIAALTTFRDAFTV